MSRQNTVVKMKRKSCFIFSATLSAKHSVQPALSFVTGSSRKYLQDGSDSSHKVYVQNIGPMNNPIEVNIFINHNK